MGRSSGTLVALFSGNHLAPYESYVVGCVVVRLQR
jgi:hypothetical protein